VDRNPPRNFYLIWILFCYEFKIEYGASGILENCMSGRELFRLGVAEIVKGLAAGAFRATDVVQSCLDRIAERDGQVGAWTEIARGQAVAAAARPFDPAARLAGVPFGVKDVIETGDMPTQMGSRLYEGSRPRYDAGVVGQLKSDGAIVLGKTVTCEFAGTEPAETVNPLAPGHTPGGSSSGSAAAVADFMAPFALGTQTGGSVLRPAAFCGVVGFKPTYGFYSIAGMKPAAHSFDTIGLIARSVADISLVHSVLMNAQLAAAATSAPRVGLFRSHLDETVTEPAARAFGDSVRLLEMAGAKVIEVAAPAGFDTITEQRAVINAFERSRGLASEWSGDSDMMGKKTRAIVERGFPIDGERYAAARQAVESFRLVIDAAFDEVDLLVTPTAPGPAPQGKEDTGDPRLQELWTMLHMPSISIPIAGKGGALPLGFQLVGRRFEDAGLLAAAGWAAEQIER
jgi:Asp-tRNA(Asn)/Glu-tRNA(Gln) amidotransferase A subunit family amidase